jgi:hypothetical protein
MISNMEGEYRAAWLLLETCNRYGTIEAACRREKIRAMGLSWL